MSSCSVAHIHNIHVEFYILLYEIYATLGHWIIHISSALNSRTPLQAAGPELVFLPGRQTSQYHLDYRRLNISYHTGLMTYSSAGMTLLNIGQHDKNKHSSQAIWWGKSRKTTDSSICHSCFLIVNKYSCTASVSKTHTKKSNQNQPFRLGCTVPLFYQIPFYIVKFLLTNSIY